MTKQKRDSGVRAGVPEKTSLSLDVRHVTLKSAGCQQAKCKKTAFPPGSFFVTLGG